MTNVDSACTVWSSSETWRHLVNRPFANERLDEESTKCTLSSPVMITKTTMWRRDSQRLSRACNCVFEMRRCSGQIVVRRPFKRNQYSFLTSRGLIPWQSYLTAWWLPRQFISRQTSRGLQMSQMPQLHVVSRSSVTSAVAISTNFDGP